MTSVPTQANLEKGRSEEEQTALWDQGQGKRVGTVTGSMADHGTDQKKWMSDSSEDPLSTKSTSPPWERANAHSTARPEVRHLSGNFNAPTTIELERHNKTKKSRSFRGTIKAWVKKSPPSTIA